MYYAAAAALGNFGPSRSLGLLFDESNPLNFSMIACADSGMISQSIRCKNHPAGLSRQSRIVTVMR